VRRHCAVIAAASRRRSVVGWRRLGHVLRLLAELSVAADVRVGAAAMTAGHTDRPPLNLVVLRQGSAATPMFA